MFETKVILIAIGEIVRSKKTRKEIYNVIAEMAAADGVTLRPFEDNASEDKEE